MKRALKLFVPLVVAALLSACQQREAATAAAADFTLQDLNGKTVRLSDFKGKTVLIDFWATWCPPCRAAIPGLEKLHKSYQSRGLVVLGVSMDQGGWDSVKNFSVEYGMTYPILKGTDDIFENYQVRAIPMAVLINREGRIVKRYLGFGGEEDLEKDIAHLL